MPWYDSSNPDRWAVSIGVRIIIAIVFFTVILGGLAWWWAPWKGAIEERNQTVGDGTYRIASYDWYFDQCNSIVSKEQIITSYRQQLENPPEETPDAAVRIDAAIMAENNVRIELVNEYNSNADKERTKAQFKDDGLPDHIDATAFDKGELTTCGH